LITTSAQAVEAKIENTTRKMNPDNLFIDYPLLD